MQQLICINDTYSPQHLEVFAKNNIQFPKKDEIVELVRVDRLPLKGKTGLIVAPYDGQFLKGKAYGIDIEKEVSFDKSRFTTLLGEPISEEILNEIKNIINV